MSDDPQRIPLMRVYSLQNAYGIGTASRGEIWQAFDEMRRTTSDDGWHQSAADLVGWIDGCVNVINGLLAEVHKLELQNAQNQTLDAIRGHCDMVTGLWRCIEELYPESPGPLQTLYSIGKCLADWHRWLKQDLQRQRQSRDPPDEHVIGLHDLADRFIHSTSHLVDALFFHIRQDRELLGESREMISELQEELTVARERSQCLSAILELIQQERDRLLRRLEEEKAQRWDEERSRIRAEVDRQLADKNQELADKVREVARLRAETAQLRFQLGQAGIPYPGAQDAEDVSYESLSSGGEDSEYDLVPEAAGLLDWGID